MMGLISLVLTLGWLVASLFIATWILRRLPFKRKGVRWLAGVLVVAALFLLPIGDMVIARARIEYLCRTDPLVREVRFFGTIPGYDRDFYTSAGVWKSNTDRNIPGEERARIDRLSEELLDIKSQKVIPRGLLPMAAFDMLYLERQTGRLLASYRSYHMYDGLLLRNIFPGPGRVYCQPPDIARHYVHPRIFPFASNAEEGKR